MTISIIDLNKKFYSYRKDLILLEKTDAVKEAIKNCIKLSNLDIPFNDVAANIDNYQLQYLTHYNATQLVKEIERNLLKIDFVEKVIINFHYKTKEKKIELKVKLKEVNQDVIYNLNLVGN